MKRLLAAMLISALAISSAHAGEIVQILPKDQRLAASGTEPFQWWAWMGKSTGHVYARAKSTTLAKPETVLREMLKQAKLVLGCPQMIELPQSEVRATPRTASPDGVAEKDWFCPGSLDDGRAWFIHARAGVGAGAGGANGDTVGAAKMFLERKGATGPSEAHKKDALAWGDTAIPEPRAVQ